MDPFAAGRIFFVILGVFSATFASLGLVRYAHNARSALCPHCATRETSIRFTIVAFATTILALLGTYALPDGDL